MVPDIQEAEIEEVVDTLRSGWITTGPKTMRFEEQFREYTGAKYAIAVNSCTAALHIALTAVGVGPGDEVITTPLTFCSVANVIIHLGGVPVLADIGEDYNINPEEIERHITARTKAILPVHYSGQPCNMDRIMEIARKHKLVVIEDAAHAAGGMYNDRMIGTIGDVTGFSFYAIKNMTTAEGGMITTEDDHLAQKMRLLSLHGISADAWKRYSKEGSWYYEVLYPGYKDNMTDIQASLGIHQLARLERYLETRRSYASIYTEAFDEAPEILTPIVNAGIRHAWHLYVILLNLEMMTIDRARFIEELREINIGTSVHFIPIHLHPYYRDSLGYRQGDFPNAEWVYDRCISLPIYPKMSPRDVEDVIVAVRHVAQKYRR